MAQHLCDAARDGKFDTVKRLVNWGGLLTGGRPVSVNAKEEFGGNTPLHQASWNGHVEICAWLVLVKGAGIEATDNIGSTPFHKAVSNGQVETAKWFLDAGANINAKNNHGDTPLDRIKADKRFHSAFKRLLPEMADAASFDDAEEETAAAPAPSSAGTTLALSSLDPRGKEPFDVFLVHTGTQKRTEVFALKRTLSRGPNAVRCFLDQDDMAWTGGSPTKYMRYALETCRYAIVVVSKEFLQRKDPCAELDYSFKRMEWIREHGNWESLCVILCNVTVEEYKELRRTAPIAVPKLGSEVTMVLWNSSGCHYDCWDDVCEDVKKRVVAHDEAGALQNWKDFLEQLESNSGDALSSFPEAKDLYK